MGPKIERTVRGRSEDGPKMVRRWSEDGLALTLDDIDNEEEEKSWIGRARCGLKKMVKHLGFIGILVLRRVF